MNIIFIMKDIIKYPIVLLSKENALSTKGKTSVQSNTLTIGPRSRLSVAESPISFTSIVAIKEIS